MKYVSIITTILSFFLTFSILRNSAKKQKELFVVQNKLSNKNIYMYTHINVSFNSNKWSVEIILTRIVV